MRKRKGFTLIELMVVVLIVAVLAAIIVPMMTSRIEKARTSEGKAIAGQIATALRAAAAEDGGVGGSVNLTGSSVIAADGTITSTGLGFKAAELNGKYYTQGGTTGVANGATLNADGTMTYTITVASKDPTKCPNVTLQCTNNVTTITP